MMKPSLRFVLAAVLIASAAIYLQAHSRGEVLPPRLSLQSFPEQLGPWTGADYTIPADQLAVLGPGEFLARSYQNEPQTDNLELFIAYYPTQRVGETTHSPKNCLPGAGWIPIENDRVTLSLPGHSPFLANRYLIANHDSRQLVLYWFWSHGRGIASEYWFKYHLIKDSIKMHRSDGALVRLIVPMSAGETAEQAEQRLLPFTSLIVPLLDSYIPR